MLTLLLIFISACFIVASFFIDASKFVRRVICLIVGLYVAVVLTPLILPVMVNALNGLLPIVFIRIILILAILFGVNAVVTKLWQKVTQLIHTGNINQTTERSKATMLLAVVFNATLGFFVFVTLLLGFAAAVDYKLFSPVVSKETYYQTIANAVSGRLFGRVPAVDYIVESRPDRHPGKNRIDRPTQQHTDKYKEYEDYDRSRKNRSGYEPRTARADSQPARAEKKAARNQKVVDNDSRNTDREEDRLDLPELNLDDKDVEALQQIVTEEVSLLLKENPEELKRALSEALTEEKGEELSAIIDVHIREGRNINELMEKIELFMGEPKNLSTEFKDALPDMLREMDFVKD